MSTPNHRRQLVLATLLAPLAPLMPEARAHGSAGHAAPAAATPEQTDWGIEGRPGRVARGITLRMDDRMRFTPDHLEVTEGETLRLRIVNAGRVMHEFVLGTPATLDEHAALMMKFPDMVHGDPWMAHVPPGGRGEIVWHFNRPGTFAFACLIAGHYQAGMRGTVRVRPAAQR